MGNAKRDDNYVTTLIAVSNADGTTPVTLYANPTTHRLLVSATSGALDDLSDVVITSGAQGDILYNNGTNWVNLAAGTAGKFLKTGGPAANPSWDTPTAGAAGSDTHVQFNDGGTNLGGDAGFLYNKTTDVATLVGGLIIGNGGALKTTTTLGNTVLIQAYDNDTGPGYITFGTLTAGNTPSFELDNTTLDTAIAKGTWTASGTWTIPAVTLGGTVTSNGQSFSGTIADLGIVTTVDINGGTIDGATIGGSVAGAITGTTITANTGFMPDANDGAYLGQSGTAFSDLFLASGAVINFDAGAATITHGANLLTISGSGAVTLALGTNSITMTGSLAATGARVTKGWFTDIESTNMPTVGGTAILTSLTAPTFNTIELGTGQTDTTLSRVSAGVVAIEGVNILTVAGGTLTGNITLGENTAIALDPAGSADGKYSGITVAGTAGAALAFGDLIYLDPTDSRWELADANAAAAADGDARGILGICVLAAAGDGSATTILLQGIVRADTAFPAMTIGAPLYVSETAGDVVVTQPTTTDVVIRIVGVAITADEMFFRPDFTWVTHT